MSNGSGGSGGNGGGSTGGRKIIDTIRSVQEQGGTTVSLEFFPAKTEEGISNLLARIEVRLVCGARCIW